MPAEVTSIRMFATSLADMLPIDLVALLRAPPGLPASTMTMLAQMWEPHGVDAFLAAPEATSKKPTAEVLATCFATAARHLDQLRRDGGPAHRAHQSHLEFLQHNGVCKDLGMVRLGKRLGLLRDAEPRDGEGAAASRPAIVTLGAGRALVLTDSPTQQLRDMVKSLNFSAPPAGGSPTSTEVFEKYAGYLRKVDGALRELPGWAGMKGQYVRPHVLRKIALWLLRSRGYGGLADPGTWARGLCSYERAGPTELFDTLSPDSCGHLARIPKSYRNTSTSFAQLLRSFAALDVHPLHITMWACFFGTAFKKWPIARQWVDDAAKDVAAVGALQARFATAKALCQSREGCTKQPTATDVVEAMMT